MDGVNSVVCRFALILALASLLSARDVPTLALVSDRPRGTGNVRQLTYSPDGRLLAVVTTTGFQVRDAESGRVLNSIVDAVPATPYIVVQFPEPWLNELCWSPDGTQIARVHGGIEIWSLLGSTPERTLPADAAGEVYYDLAWSPNGKEIAAHSDTRIDSRVDLGIVVWSLESSQRTIIPEKAPNDGFPDQWLRLEPARRPTGDRCRILGIGSNRRMRCPEAGASPEVQGRGGRNASTALRRPMLPDDYLFLEAGVGARWVGAGAQFRVQRIGAVECAHRRIDSSHSEPGRNHLAFVVPRQPAIAHRYTARIPVPEPRLGPTGVCLPERGPDAHGCHFSRRRTARRRL